VTAPQVKPFLDAEAAALLESELAFQASHRHDKLPRGPVHADLFRDNVLFDGAGLGGFIDFYFAGYDCLLFDVAVCVNDWCIAREGLDAGDLDAQQVGEFLEAYDAVRPFAAEEQAAWDVMLRAAALRFWLSRLFDFHLPRAGQLITPHDPGHFERILARRRARPAPWK
jgi:homoserine kinase type II